jgi:hypothetical protein
VPEAERLAAVARGDVDKLFNEAWRVLQNGLSDIGLKVSLVRPDDATPQELSRALASEQEWFEEVERRVNS